MKHIKKFEKFDDNSIIPEIGDYVIMNIHTIFRDLKDFIKNNVGEIIDINSIGGSILVKYFNIPEDIKDFLSYGGKYINHYFDRTSDEKNMYQFYIEDIKEISKDKEKLEVILAAKKYNI